MRKYKSILIISTLIFLFFSSCEDDTYCYINQAAKDWGVYKKGSWWVYKEESTNSIDSVSVENYSEEMLEDISDKKSWFAEYISISYYRTFDSTIVEETIGPHACNDGMIKLKVENETLNTKYYVDLLWLTPNIVESFKFVTQTEVVNRYDSLKVEEKYYKDVVQIKCDVMNYVPSENYESVNNYWISKHNWIIKKNICTNNDTITWNLINSFVIK